MISKISVVDKKYNKYPVSHDEKKQQSPSFKAGLWSVALSGLQECEKNPMVNVAVIDMFSAILPRTFVESLTNGFAGFEALRRESSGLIVNCLIPGMITLGFAKLVNGSIMPKGANLSSCWADGSLINSITDIYSKTSGQDKVKDTFKEILSNVQGYSGKNEVNYGEELKNQIEGYAEKLAKLVNDRAEDKVIKNEIKSITKELADQTHVYENVKLLKGDVKASTISSLLSDSVKYLKEYKKVENNVSIQDFAKKSAKLVKTKSILGMMTILPLAASMQYINRWITEKTSGVKGAPIYDDFGKDGAIKDEKAKEGLFRQKIISIASMVGVSLLSMMKMPSWKMFEFKGLFPTMDQARIISTTTFASRMAVADDKNELAESTTRDIATFVSLYFLGDYAAKAVATAIQKKTDICLLNETKKLDANAGVLKKFWHWVKDVNIKSSEEVISKTAEKLKLEGKTPTAEEKKIIEKELKKATNLRSACQVANLGVSLLLLGLIIPIFTRKNTEKKHAEALKLAEQSSSTIQTEENSDVDKSSAKKYKLQ